MHLPRSAIVSDLLMLAPPAVDRLLERARREDVRCARLAFALAVVGLVCCMASGCGTEEPLTALVDTAGDIVYSADASGYHLSACLSDGSRYVLK